MLLSPALATAAEPLEQQLNIQNQNFDQRRTRENAERLHEVGRQNIEDENYDLGILAWEQAIALYSTLGDEQAVEQITDDLAKILITLERYDDARRVVLQQIAQARTNNDIKGQVYGLNNLGTIHLQQNRIAQAQETFVTALQVAEAGRSMSGMGLSLSNLGLAARILGDWNSARSYYEAATNYRLQGDDDIGLAHSSNSLGLVYQRLGEPNKALGAFLVARRTALETGHVPTLLTALDGLINIYSNRGEIAQLQQYIDERIALTPDDASPAERIGLLIGLGKLYEQTGELRQAREVYNEALAIANQLADNQQRNYILNRLQALSFNSAG